ncbi:aromatic ring-hydroxylating oxygenase subunit alpha [Aliarcobacter butzleri]|uniref:aromatic ring-hydroxylating oxygenase subunit alpha n=1 Tax=Aliarcobacter butzleri TaxID=28197 RepID=UPI0021B4A966|nr:SRPBCC family protein [Aliarcobacter butzleri]MCT7580018.1 Rieske 2Fe-2S domain-containing protein [Aliarcobacter butzleri]MCT7584792.1 Rieske 2Fe-2S domain-containing protein [Aliarcobacter butzleri]
MKKVNDYFSNENYNLEKEKLFENFYHFGCHISELKDDTNYIKLTIFENEIIIYNDDKNIICFDNICPHRGAPLICTNDNEGSKRLICQYHGWNYSKGKLNIPNKNLFNSETIINRDLFKYKIEKVGDFIFFSKNPIISVKEQLGTFYSILEEISKSINKKIDLNRNKFLSNWKISLENALENYHVPYIHPNTLAPLKLTNGNIEFESLNSLWLSEISNEKAFKKLQKLKSFFNEDIFYKENYFSIYLFPFSMISSTFGYSYAFQSFFPNTPQETSFYSRTYSIHSKLDTEAFYDSVKNINRQIFDEDISVCNLLQKSLKNRNIDFVYNQMEKRILNFQKNYEKFMEKSNDKL